jgi:uncharacterized membrane protein
MNKIDIIKFFTPFGIAGIVALILILADPVGLKYATEYGGLMLAYFFPLNPLGRMTIILGAAAGLGFVLSVLSIVFVDAVSSLFIVWNFDIATKIPFIGKFLLKSEEKGRKALEKYPWVRGLSFIGVMLFVAIPFLGTNAVIGSIIGEIVGMKPKMVWIAVVIGSIIGVMMIAIPVYYGVNLFK